MNIKICSDIKYVCITFNKNVFIKMLIIFNYLRNLFLKYFTLVKYIIITLKCITIGTISYFFSENTFYAVKKNTLNKFHTKFHIIIESFYRNNNGK